MKIRIELEFTEAETNDFKPFRTTWRPLEPLYFDVEVPDKEVYKSGNKTVLTSEGASILQAAIAKVSTRAYMIAGNG